MAGVLRGVGKLFGFGDPKVDPDLMAAENRAKLKARADEQALQQDAEAARIRSARGGRRAALASQLNLGQGETLG
jgi:hypothetical protein